MSQDFGLSQSFRYPPLLPLLKPPVLQEMEGGSAEGVNFDDDRKMIVAPRMSGRECMGVLFFVTLCFRAAGLVLVLGFRVQYLRSG